jgi:hypothetical protein
MYRTPSLRWLLASSLAGLFGLGIGLSASVLTAHGQGIGPEPPRDEKVQPSPGAKTLGDGFKKLFGGKKQQAAEDNAKNNQPQVPTQMMGPGREPERQLPNNGKKAKDDAGKAVPERPPLIAEPAGPDAVIEPPMVSEDNPPPPKPVRLDQADNPLGLADSRARLKVCGSHVDAKRYEQAESCLIPLRQWLIDSTEGHISLYKTLSNLPSARVQAEFEKQVALEFAKMRDQAFYRLAQVNVAQNQPRKAVRDLVDIVKSQPKSELGLKAYELLQTIGFTERIQLAD